MITAFNPVDLDREDRTCSDVVNSSDSSAGQELTNKRDVVNHGRSRPATACRSLLSDMRPLRGLVRERSETQSMSESYRERASRTRGVVFPESVTSKSKATRVHGLCFSQGPKDAVCYSSVLHRFWSWLHVSRNKFKPAHQTSRHNRLLHTCACTSQASRMAKAECLTCCSAALVKRRPSLFGRSCTPFAHRDSAAKASDKTRRSGMGRQSSSLGSLHSKSDSSAFSLISVFRTVPPKRQIACSVRIHQEPLALSASLRKGRTAYPKPGLGSAVFLFRERTCQRSK